MKIVVNRCYGRFSLSEAACRAYAEAKGFEIYDYQYGGWAYTKPASDRTDSFVWRSDDIPRDDKTLVDIVERMGPAANGLAVKLEVVEIPDDVDWQIEDDDGREWVAEKHRTW